MPSVRRALATALISFAALAAPAGASTSDGTSNTVVVSLDAAHHRLVLAGSHLDPGRHATVTLRSHRYTIILTDVLVSSLSSAETLSLNFTKVEVKFMDYTDDVSLVVGGQFGEEG